MVQRCSWSRSRRRVADGAGGSSLVLRRVDGDGRAEKIRFLAALGTPLRTAFSLLTNDRAGDLDLGGDQRTSRPRDPKDGKVLGVGLTNPPRRAPAGSFSKRDEDPLVL